ncbi:MAG: cytochrome b/b6 domain-containing protein [Nitriliruptoraceae bacterium]
MSETTLKQPAITEDGERILRYRPGQRYVHLLVAVSFVALFLTGLPLIFEPLSFLAAGGWSRILHRVAAVGFMSVPILYFIVDREGMKELIKESFTYDKDDLRWLSHMGRYFLGNAADMPPQGRLNAGQKLHHAAVIILGAGVVFSGVFVWVSAGTMSDTMLSWSMLIHNVSMLGLVLLLVGHIYFTVVYKALTSMHTGYVPKADAEIEHAKWVAEIEAREAEARAAQERLEETRRAAGMAADEDPSKE